MEFISKTVPNNLNIFWFGDLHIGTKLFYAKGVFQFIEDLTSEYDGCKNNVAIGVGDYIEAIDHTDHRFDVDSIDLNKIRPQQQIEHFIRLFEPVKDKIVCLLIGNHEWKLLKYYDYAQSAAHKLGVPYGTYSAVITFKRKKKDKHLLKVYVTHGSGSINSIADDPERVEANLNLSLKRKLKHKAGDTAIMGMGHTHKLLVARPKTKLYLTSNERELEQHYTKSEQTAQYIHPDHRWYINTGSFVRSQMRGISGYAERAMYDPLELGYCVAKIRDRKIIGVDKVFV
jgi:hypothetical protein